MDGRATPISYGDRFLDPRCAAAKAIIQQGIESGEFDTKLDQALAIDSNI